MIKKLATLVVAALAVAGSARAQQPTYTPGTYRFRIASEQHQKQEMMGQTQETNTQVTQHVTVTLAPGSAGALNFTVTLDSVQLDSVMSALPQAQEQVKSMVGKSASGTVTPAGQVLTFVPPDTTGTSNAQWASFRNLFVRVPADSRKGNAVTDTTTNTFNSQGLEISQTVVMTNTVAGDTTAVGGKAVRLERSGTLNVSGSGEQQGQALVMDGTGTINGAAVVAPAMGLLRATATSTSQLTVQLPAMSMSIPITQNGTTTIEQLAKK